MVQNQIRDIINHYRVNAIRHMAQNLDKNSIIWRKKNFAAKIIISLI